MFEIFTALMVELSVKALIGVFLYKANPNFAYAYATLEVYRYYQAFERYLSMRKILKNIKGSGE